MRDIVITIDADRRAAAPRNVGIICDNSDVRISFSIATGSGFNTAEPIFAIFVTDRGELPAVSFTGGSVIAPVFGAEDGAYVRIGLCQGEIKTSSPATLHLLGSAHSVAHGASADPHADEYARVIDELTEDDKILVERASDGYRGAALISALAALIGGGGGTAELVIVTYGDTTAGLYASLTAALAEDKLIILAKDGVLTASLKAGNDALTWSVPWADSIGVWRYSLSSAGVWSTDSEAGVRLYQGTQQGGKYMAVSALTGTVGPTAPDTEPTANSLKLLTSGGAFAALDKKVTKEQGKGLSTNDYDAEAKAKVDAIPADPHYDAGTFDAIYGVTTWAEFVSAVQAGKSIKVVDGINYGWADIIDIDHEYASFVIISGEDYGTLWCEFGNNDGVNEWSAWRGDALVPESILQTALATKQDKTAQVEITTDGAVTQALDAGKIYLFSGDLTSLTITLNAPASGQLPQYHFIFTAGATAPTVTLPNSVQMPDDWAVDAHTRYEIDILNGYGLASSWEVIQK